MRKHNFAFIDIETTGLDVRRHEIIEIGCILTTPELKVIEEFELKIKPERIADADPVSLKISHYDPDRWGSAHNLDNVSVAWAKLHKDPDLEHFSLRELCLRFGIENKEAHTALSDARATYELYKKLMEL